VQVVGGVEALPLGGGAVMGALVHNRVLAGES